MYTLIEEVSLHIPAKFYKQIPNRTEVMASQRKSSNFQLNQHKTFYYLKFNQSLPLNKTSRSFLSGLSIKN